MSRLTPLKRKFYQRHPLLWMRDRLGVPLEFMEWSKSDFDSYFASGRIDEQGNIIADAWDGTPDPFKATMDALATGWKRKGETRIRGVAIESATGTGKTYLAACAVLWFLDVYGDPDKPKEACKVVTFAPTEDQLKDHMWAEIDSLWPKFQKLHPQAIKLKLEIRMGRENWNAKGDPVGVSRDEQSATKAQGIHGAHVLIILEETPGINPAVLTAVENTLTGEHNVLLAIGNPDSVNDPLHELWVKDNMLSVRISGFDHPNVVMDDPNFIVGATTRMSLEDQLTKYKEETHPMYMSRARGFCPDTVAQCLFRPNALAASAALLKDPIEEIDLNGTVTEGQIKIYYQPTFTHLNRYIVFADPAGDAGNRDWHAAIVMDRLKRRPAAVLHMRGPRNEFVEALLMMCNMYKVPWTEMSAPGDPRFYYALLNWERRGVGALSLSEKVVAYPAIYYSRNIEIPAANTRAAMGWDTNTKTRKDMVNALEEWGLSLFDNAATVVDKELHNEMKNFVWVPKGTHGNGRFEAAPNHHDDLVMAWAGCLMTDKVIGPVVKQVAPNDVEDSKGAGLAMLEFARKLSQPPRRRGKKDKWDSVKIPNSF